MQINILISIISIKSLFLVSASDTWSLLVSASDTWFLLGFIFQFLGFVRFWVLIHGFLMVLGFRS
ncbi:hypothetical protein RhiirC2_785218 [Rhizophagus irregularis]|uniref:Uncharacterized protein n=1 Tax=Rhizophagus irregularis TaxID=588596 RepID=A0A2N1MWX6_9GLOM|nr:hypothetical protein RhiirC2_785218 [Rhizophagus irregularis]